MADHEDLLLNLRRELEQELTGRLLPYWVEYTVDGQHGGFVGRINGNNQVVPEAPKGVVLNARLLWTFAAATRLLEDERCEELAHRAYAYLLDHFWDARHEGLFWMVDHAGQPLETRKQVYAQAFGVYALAEYHRATGENEALQRATRLFRAMERHTHDDAHGGYLEVYSRDWQPLDNMRLSERDPAERKSMNTHLHVMEAYANLLRTWPEEPVRKQLQALVEIFIDVIFNASTGHLRTFFAEDWSVRSESISFGHDIEASWLLTEAADLLGEEELQNDAHRVAVRLAETTFQEGVDADHGVLEEAEPHGITDEDRYGWPQAEALVGFVNAFELTDEPRFLGAAQSCWEFVKRFLLDEEHGEWFWRVNADGRPYPEDNKVGPWKGPYHSTRACLEVITRADALRVSSSTPDGIPALTDSELASL